MAGSSRSRHAAPTSQHAKSTPHHATPSSALESALRSLLALSNTAPHTHHSPLPAASTNTATVELLNTLVHAHHTLIHLLASASGHSTLPTSPYTRLPDAFALALRLVSGAAPLPPSPLSYLDVAAAGRHAPHAHRPRGLRPGHCTIKVLSPIQSQQAQLKRHASAPRVAFQIPINVTSTSVGKNPPPTAPILPAGATTVTASDPPHLAWSTVVAPRRQSRRRSRSRHVNSAPSAPVAAAAAVRSQSGTKHSSTCIPSPPTVTLPLHATAQPSHIRLHWLEQGIVANPGTRDRFTKSDVEIESLSESGCVAVLKRSGGRITTCKGSALKVPRGLTSVIMITSDHGATRWLDLGAQQLDFGSDNRVQLKLTEPMFE